MRRTIEPIVALLTFSIGLSLSLMDNYPVVLLWPVMVFFMFYFLLLGVIIHQLMVRKDNRLQVIGKGVLAAIVWSVPSTVAFSISLDYMMRSNESPFTLIMITTGGLYGLVGWVLCRWVKSHANEGLGIWERGGWSNR